MGASKCDLSCATAATNWDAAQTRRPRSEISTRAFQEGFRLRTPPGAKPADLPFDLSLEPPKPSKRHQHLGGKILKLLKLQLWKSKSAPSLPVQDFHRPALRVLHFQDLITQSTQFSTPDDVTKRSNYDSSDETTSRPSNSGSSEADSSRSSGSHLSNSQLMANILISIMDEKDLASEEPGDVQTIDGPHESAWHQPRDETNLVDSPTVRGRQSGTSSMKRSRGGPRSDGLFTSPGPSRRYGKLDLSRIEVNKIRG